VLVKRAQERQERDYLHAWLHTRADRAGRPIEPTSPLEARQVRRLVGAARTAGIEWTKPPQRGVTFDGHLKAVILEEAGTAPATQMARKGGRRGREMVLPRKQAS
jgi:hypothetical protein